jgi:hypothetical protein
VVGVVFASIGVAVTLYFTLRTPDPDPRDMSTYPTTTTAPPAPPPELGPVAPRTTARPQHNTSIGPSPGLAPLPTSTKGKHR